ncbi:MAG: hypothetical protein AB1646_20695 [Thermodesulfobacteriota bacterium]
MSFLECIRREYNHVRKDCAEPGEGHRVNRKGLPRHVIVNGDAMDPANASSDCICFFESEDSVTVAVVELMGNLKDISHRVKKLRNAAAIAEKIVKACNTHGHRVAFFPIIYHHGIGNPQLRKLRKHANGVFFRGYNHLVIQREYKIPLARVLTST